MLRFLISRSLIFALSLENKKQAWALGLGKFSENTYADYPPGVEANERELLGNIVRSQIKQMQSRLPDQGNDKERAAQVQALIDLLLQDSR